jgi:hypothetical protein
MSRPWSDLYSGDDLPVQTLDPTAAALLQLIPEDRRPMAQAMLGPMFLAIKATVSEADYQAFCADMGDAVEAHKENDAGKAAAILARYGLDYALFLGSVEEATNAP